MDIRSFIHPTKKRIIIHAVISVILLLLYFNLYVPTIKQPTAPSYIACCEQKPPPSYCSQELINRCSTYTANASFQNFYNFYLGPFLMIVVAYLISAALIKK